MALGGGAELWREAGTDRYYVREAVEDPTPSTSVRDLRRLRPIGRHQSPADAARHAGVGA